MLVELDLPESVVRKIKALNALEGGHSATSLQLKLVGLLEYTLDTAICAHVQTPSPLGYSSYTTAMHLAATQQAQAPVNQKSRSLNLADELPPLEDGLGDLDETEIPPEEGEEALVPQRGGLSERALDKDMEVDDPEHEAKVDAPEEIPYSKAEEAFAHITGIPLPVEPMGELDGRVARRKRRLNIKGRVVPMTDEFEADRNAF